MISNSINELIKIRNKEMELYFWDVLTLDKVSKKYRISRERVRQIFEKNGFDSNAVKQAILDYNKYHKIDAMYTTCECGTFFIPDRRRVEHNRLIDCCSVCYIKKRAKLDGYKAQKTWHNKNRDRVRKTQKIYYGNNKQYFTNKAKQYILDNPEKCKRIAHKSYMKNREKRLAYSKKYHAEHKRKKINTKI